MHGGEVLDAVARGHEPTARLQSFPRLLDEHGNVTAAATHVDRIGVGQRQPGLGGPAEYRMKVRHAKPGGILTNQRVVVGIHLDRVHNAVTGDPRRLEADRPAAGTHVPHHACCLQTQLGERQRPHLGGRE